MSVSAIFGVRVALPSVATPRRAAYPANLTAGGGAGAFTIECSSRPQKKATKHHMKTRPKKTQPWDVRRKPAIYDPLPPLPPDVTLVASVAVEGGEGGGGVEAAEPVLSEQ